MEPRQTAHGIALSSEFGLDMKDASIKAKVNM